ncbi:hypothetical protein EZV62_002222 [Acer yangbiense]|uniref:Uncharacterized protein n=1 Tax=Acer yangbiense TaxID=1000413 RepID=A0A5C7IWN7_9ROSI|nr:hypothetical protein EZV62_002222 [Acer yangbiense]
MSSTSEIEQLETPTITHATPDSVMTDEFKELKAIVRVREIPMTFEDLYDKLLDEELNIKRCDSVKNDI